MNKLGTKLGAIAMSAVMALSFAPSAAITSLAAGGDDLTDATQELSVPIYRLYNPNSGEHLFTTSENERDYLDKNDWDYEDIAWYAPTEGDQVYRLYNPNHPLGDHHYTASEEEKDNLLKEGWRLDQTAFYTAEADDLLRDEVISLYNPNAYDLEMATHHLTLSQDEADGLAALGWVNEGVKFYGYAEDLDPEPVEDELTVTISNTTPKVGDTIRALIYDADGNEINIDDLEGATVQWFAGNEEIDEADDIELVVGDELVGLQIFVEVTDAEGKTYESDPTEPVYVYSFDIEEASAKKVNEIKVTFANPVEAENVTFTVTKGNEAFPIEKVEATDWSLDEKEVTLKTSANMTKGTYTVTATDSVTSDTDSADFEVDKQAVAGIVIKNEVALTNKDKDEAYAYYDVLDQYGESIRSSASIQWAGSCDIKADKATGKLTLTKHTADDDWVYGEQIYITGVYTKTGTATNATLTVGTEQNLDTIDIVGFLKKGTSKIIEDLPADFKTEAYYMLFHALDQNGCPLKADQIDKESVTFITDSPLVVKEVTFGEGATSTEKKAFTVEGEEYNAVFVNPGINVAKGGEVNVTAIANKTGNKTDYNFWVGPDAVVTSFKLTAPSGVVADGDTNVKITFTAETEDGQAITNFRQLAKQEIFNTLSFTASEGTLTLMEGNDRSAGLFWSDNAKYVNGDTTGDGRPDVSPWSFSETTDDIDRPVSLTVVVVGGEPDNEMLSVQDKRRPNSIAKVNLNDVYVEGHEFTLTTGSFQYYDQYGKLIDEDGDASDYGDDNGFFAAADAKVLRNTEFQGYDFGVRIENAGTGKVVWDAASTTTSISDETLTGTATPNPKKAVVYQGKTAAYETTKDIKSVATGEGFKFEIAKFKDTDKTDIDTPADWDAVSPTKFHGLTVVDITQVKNFQIGDLATLYTGYTVVTGDKIISEDYLDKLKSSSEVTTVTSGVNNVDADHQKTVKVSGTYNGTKVDIPATYFTIATTKNSLVDSDDDKDFDQIGEINITSLYDKTTANGNAKLGQDEAVATIVQLYGENENETGFWVLAVDDDGKLTGKFELDDDTTAQAANTQITNDAADAKAIVQRKAANEVLDKYGFEEIAAGDDVGDWIAANTVAQAIDEDDIEEAKTELDDADNDLVDATKAFETAEVKAENAKAYKAEKKTAAEATAATEQQKQNAANTAATELQTATGQVGAEKERADQLWSTSTYTPQGGTTPILFDKNTPDTTINAAVETANNTQAWTNMDNVKTYLIAYKNDLKAKDDLAEATEDNAAAQVTLDAAAAAEANALAAKAEADTELTAATNAQNDAQLAYETAVKGYAASVAKKAGEDFDTDVAAKTTANGTGKTTIPAVYDTAKKDITYSDQAPYAADITGLLDSYTFNPFLTGIDAGLGGFYDATQKKGAADLEVVDQYGVAMANEVLEFTISNAVEDKDGYAENNFKVSDNGTIAPSIDGAEIGDTFDLVVSVKGSTLKKTTKVTVGADFMASIVDSNNNYNKFLKPELERQRKAGLQ